MINTPSPEPSPVESCPIRVLGARVVVRIVPEPPASKLIATPDNAKPRAQRGVVVGVGTGREYPRTGFRIPADVKIGDLVVFTKFADVRDLFGRFGENGDLAAVSQEEILCVIEDDESSHTDDMDHNCVGNGCRVTGCENQAG